MGTTWGIFCLECRQWAYLGKIAEEDFPWIVVRFSQEHPFHNVMIMADEQYIHTEDQYIECKYEV